MHPKEPQKFPKGIKSFKTTSPLFFTLPLNSFPPFFPQKHKTGPSLQNWLPSSPFSQSHSPSPLYHHLSPNRHPSPFLSLIYHPVYLIEFYYGNRLATLHVAKGLLCDRSSQVSSHKHNLPSTVLFSFFFSSIGRVSKRLAG